MGNTVLTVPKRFKAKERRLAACAFLRAFGRSPSVHFEFSHYPCTNGKTVWLGELKAGSRLFETFALGHGIHEMMHVRHTDFTVSAALDPLGRQLLNCLEDIRLDRLGTHENPSYHLWREALAQSSLKLGRLRATQRAFGPQAAVDNLITWLHCELNAAEGFRWAIDNVAFTRDGVRGLSEKCRRAVLRTAGRVREAASTEECAGIARKIRSLLQSQFELEREQAKEKKNQEERNLSLFSESEEAGLGQTEGGFVAQLIGFCINPPKTDAREAGLGGRIDAESFLQQVAAAGEQPASKKYRAGPWPIGGDKSAVGLMRTEFIEAFDKARPGLVRTERAFAELLRTHDEFSGSRYAREGIEFRDDWLDTLASGRRNIFETFAPGRSVNAEICVLLDRSGSMGVLTMTTAKAAVLALLTALDRIKGVTSRLSVFPGLHDDQVAIVKDAADPLAAVKIKMPSIDAFGSTPIYEAMLWAHDSFAGSKARDKLHVVVTDGRFQAQRSRDMQTKLRAMGVEFALMSIGIDNTEAADNHVLVEDESGINRGLVRLIARTAFARAVRK